LESGHRLYYDFWGVKLNGLLVPVPDCDNNLKYLPQKRIDDLMLRVRLQYPETVLLVRKEYEVAFDYLHKLYEGGPNICGGGFVVSGQPGIGVHLSLIVVSNNCH
jgi:hypothetical protein